jgi:NAD(P)-dependent dehydrogenase (short-subunit alcohol dehydrogenase family)
MSDQQRTAIVTGGAQGIGGATARRLARDGYHVLIADVDEPEAAANQTRIRKDGGSAETILCDVGKAADLEALVRRADELWGRLDVLVNNAYGWSPGQAGSAVEVSEEGWDQGMAVLAKSIFLATKHAVPLLQKQGGAIVNISSVHGYLAAPGALVYEAGKAAVIQMTRQMACDFGPLGIRVNAICPGHIVTERGARGWAENPGGLKFWDQQYPVRRTGTPDDIANAIAFLVSDQAGFITGVALPVDGGLTVQLQENLGVHLAKYAQEHPDLKLP